MDIYILPWIYLKNMMASGFWFLYLWFEYQDLRRGSSCYRVLPLPFLLNAHHTGYTAEETPFHTFYLLAFRYVIIPNQES